MNTKLYYDTRFNAEAFKEAVTAVRELAGRATVNFSIVTFEVEHDDSSWEYETIEEFLVDYRKFRSYANIYIFGVGFGFKMTVSKRNTEVSIRAPQHGEIEAIFDVFEKYSAASRLLSALPAPIVFIGHGRSPAWRDLKGHLQDKHGIKVEAYESGARAGHTIRDILEDMVSKSSFAILVLTGEDEQKDGLLRARQNVIHEVGLFHGRLGFARAIL